MVSSQIGDAILLNLTDHEWVDIIDKQGEILPYCCADISAMRDLLIEALRNSKFISLESLQKFVVLAEGHGETKEEPVIKKICNLWYSLDPDIKLNDKLVTMDINDIEDAVHALGDCLYNLTYAYFMQYDEREIDQYIQYVRMLPYFTKIHNYLQSRSTFISDEFYAIVDEQGNLKKLNSGGLAIYKDKEKADLVVKHFTTLKISKVRISANGVEFIK